MNITVIGRGDVGGGLADRWEKAGLSAYFRRYAKPGEL